MKYWCTVAGRDIVVDIDEEGVKVDGELVDVDLHRIGEMPLYSLLVDSVSYELIAEETRGGYQVMLGGETYDVQATDERTRRLSQADRAVKPPSGELLVKAPIPGMVVKVLVEAAQEVEAGTPLVILEAMKMENEIRAPRAGTVGKLNVEAGNSVNQGEILLALT